MPCDRLFRHLRPDLGSQGIATYSQSPLSERCKKRYISDMNDPRHTVIPNLVPTFDPDPASAGDAAPFDHRGPREDLPPDEEDGDAAEYGRDGD